jgi:hypothetical protein
MKIDELSGMSRHTELWRHWKSDALAWALLFTQPWPSNVLAHTYSACYRQNPISEPNIGLLNILQV